MCRLRCRPGQTVAILGATGSGKTTMMNLLQRLYDRDRRQDYSSAAATSFQFRKSACARASAMCFRSRFCYSRSIRDNIAITEPDATGEEIDAVAKTTSSLSFIHEFEKGYDTLVGERGVTLSGGQKQRIAIARTLLRENDILILDDSLSAVDTETDRAIREALNQSRRSGHTPTTFIVSHRVTTLADADLILVLENGEIAQQGTHRGADSSGRSVQARMAHSGGARRGTGQGNHCGRGSRRFRPARLRLERTLAYVSRLYRLIGGFSCNSNRNRIITKRFDVGLWRAADRLSETVS